MREQSDAPRLREKSTLINKCLKIARSRVLSSDKECLVSLYKYSEHNDRTPTYDRARDELFKRDALD